MISWIEEDFGRSDLGDKRLDRRLKLVAKRFYEAPNVSPKSACQGWAETVAAYRFFDNERVTVEKIFQPHQQAILERIKPYQGRKVLMLQDTSELDYHGHASLRDVGNLGDLGRKGFWAHNHYVVGDDGVPLGVWHSGFTTPVPKDPSMPKKPKDNSTRRRLRPIEEKKTFCWLQGFRLSCQLAELNPNVTIVSVSDREGDIYEVFAEYQQRLQAKKPVAHWLIRSQHDRILQDSPLSLRQEVPKAPLLGLVHFEIPARPANKKDKKPARPARTVVQELRACTVELKPTRGKESLGSIPITVVLAQEINAPEGQEPISWILLTSLKVTTLDEAIEIVDCYLSRWEIEVFHKILKSGCTVEKLQFESSDRLLPCVALYMIIAWRIHYMTKLGRSGPDLPCSVIFDEAEWKPVLRILRGPGAELQEPSLSVFISMIATLGGHLNRKCDGAPGPQTIWRGMNRVREWAICWRQFGSG